MTSPRIRMLRLPALLLSATLSLSATAGSVVPMTQEMYQMFGIIITNCVRTTRGIKVDFWTAHEPPYFVGVYPTADWLEGGYFDEVATSIGSAFIPGDYTDLPVYIEAILPSRIAQLADYFGTGTNLHTKLTSEQAEFYRSICNPLPKASIDHHVKIVGSLPVNTSTYSLVCPRYYGVEYNGTSIGYSGAATTITFRQMPIPGSAAGEESINYWPPKTYVGESYDPHSNNLWCMWSSNSTPQYIMYKDGPMYSFVRYSPVTNTVDELYDKALEGEKSVTYRKDWRDDFKEISLVRGTLYNTRGTSYAPLEASFQFIPGFEYYFGPITNTMETVEYSKGWGLRPFNYSTNAPAAEILWVDENHDTNTSNRIFLPGLFKDIENNGPIRTAQRDLGDFIIVTNTPNHWRSDFGINEIPPVSNNLFKIHYFPGDEPSPSLIEQYRGTMLLPYSK